MAEEFGRRRAQRLLAEIVAYTNCYWSSKLPEIRDEGLQKVRNYIGYLKSAKDTLVSDGSLTDDVISDIEKKMLADFE